jgi:hypothetical protein
LEGQTVTNPTEAARGVNPNIGFLAVVLEHGGAWIPPSGSGSFNTKAWGVFLGVGEKIVRDYVRKHGIPYRKAGAEKFISTDDFEKFIPYIRAEEPDPDDEE